MTWWITYPAILALLIVAELFYFRVADRLNIIDKPNLRSSHTHITLRGGGVIFLIGAWLYAAFFGLHYPWFMAGLTAICAVSFADDVHSVPNVWRLLVQFASMMLMFVDLGFISGALWWAVIPALIVCVGIINAYNFMDGINGITGAYSLAVLIPLAVLNVRYAFIILFILGRLIAATGDVQYLLLLGVYGIDTVLTIIHRILLHEHLGEAHRKHAYQLMANELHIPHTSVSFFYFALQLIVSGGLLAVPDSLQWPYTVAVLMILALAYLLFMRKYYHLHAEYLNSLKS